jgi:hypothetical protein
VCAINLRGERRRVISYTLIKEHSHPLYRERFTLIFSICVKHVIVRLILNLIMHLIVRTKLVSGETCVKISHSI